MRHGVPGAAAGLIALLHRLGVDFLAEPKTVSRKLDPEKQERFHPRV